MTAREVAELLHAPVSTAEDSVRRGVLPNIKIGKRRLYIRQNIEAVLTGYFKAASSTGVSSIEAQECPTAALARESSHAMRE